MDLDWLAQTKTADGREIAPEETLGMKLLSRDDPETIEAFRAIWQWWLL